MTGDAVRSNVLDVDDSSTAVAVRVGQPQQRESYQTLNFTPSIVCLSPTHLLQRRGSLQQLLEVLGANVFEGLIVVWILCGALGSGIARAKGLGPVKWGLICLLFGVFGVFALVLQTSRHAATLAQPDRRRWEALVQIDPEITAAAAEAMALGRHQTELLAQLYLAVDDKSYLPSIMQKVRASTADHGRLRAALGEIDYTTRQDGKVEISSGMGQGRVFKDLTQLKRYVGAA